MEWEDNPNPNPLMHLANCADSMEIISPDADGYLRLEGNPARWIEDNTPASHLLVKHLELDFSKINRRQQYIGESIDRLTLLTHLTISNAEDLYSLPNSIATLHNLRYLKFHRCEFDYLPAGFELLTNSLTHLTLEHCDIESLHDSIARLSNLTSLYIVNCDSLKELPASLGSLTHVTLQGRCIEVLTQSIAAVSKLTSLHLSDCYFGTQFPDCFAQLGNLRHLSLENCACVKSLPDSISTLLKLETLSVRKCEALIELPVNLKVSCLKLINCRIRYIPRGLINLRRLEVTPSYSVSFANLKDSINLQMLTISFPPCKNVSLKASSPGLIDTFNQLVNLQILCFHKLSNRGFVELSDHLEGLHELCFLDIQDTEVNHLPWSIMKLPKLRFLMIPWKFRLQTLPFNLNDSVLITVKGRHIRKPWKQLKQEIGVSAFPIPQGEYPSTIAPPGYLSLQGDLGQWIQDNYESRFLVKMLELKFSEQLDVKGTKNSLRELPNLTHLFATDGFNKDCIPYTFKGLKHLCLDSCGIESHLAGLDKLSNLETLDLIDTTLPKLANLPVSLRHLSLQSVSNFPDYMRYLYRRTNVYRYSCSFPANIAKLSNLQTLDLSGCRDLTSLPPLNIVTLKIKQILKSLPVSLRHLEIVHVRSDCYDKYNEKYCDSDMLEDCLAQLINLEKLSLTCYHIKFLPRMAGQPNLQVLLLKDCFALKELMPNLEQLVELHTLDISGTRIKCLPDSIIKLSKLQQLIIPKCFTQKLPTNLEELSIIDDTDRRYYKHIGYYDPDFETISDASDEASDDNEVGSVEGVDKALTEDPVQGDIGGQACEINDDIAHVPTVSRSTMKRVSNEPGIIWPSNKKVKQYHDAKGQKISKDTVATMAIGEKHPSESIKVSHMEFQHVEEHLDGANESNIAPLNGSSTSVDFVKACYDGDLVWIDISLTSSFDQLNQSVCEKFRLTINKFKIKYLDEDQEWLLMTCVSDLMHALLHTSSSGRKFVRVSITDIGTVNTEANLDGAKQLITAQPNGSSSFFDFVKACYEGDSVWIIFSLTSSFDQLKESICKKFELDVNEIKIKYLDEDKEWLLMTCVSDLTYALLHTSSSGRKFVRLSILDTRVIYTGKVFLVVTFVTVVQ